VSDTVDFPPQKKQRKWLKRVMVAGLAAAVVFAGAVFANSQAQAAGTCSVVVPSKVSIDRPYKKITAYRGSNCTSAGVVYASWEGYHSATGFQDMLIFDGTSYDYWDVYDWDLKPGLVTWRPSTAYDASYNDVPQVTAYSDVRAGSAAKISATRVGSTVTLKTAALYYYAPWSAYRGWPGAKIQLQYRNSSTGTCYYLKNVYTSSAGTASYTFNYSKARYYRAMVAGNTTIWNSSSSQILK
jgi:hypothetical protein